MPTVWEDLLEYGTYIATLVVPLGDVAPTMKYINDELGFLGGKVDVGYLSVEESYNYTMPFQMFAEGRWRFDRRKMESAVSKELNASFAK